MSKLWNAIASAAKDAWPMPVEVSLLGSVPYRFEGAKIVGEVPSWVANAAADCELEVLPPDPRRNCYVFKRAFRR